MTGAQPPRSFHQHWCEAKLLNMSSDASTKNFVRASEDVEAISRKLCLTPQEVDVHQLIDDFVIKVCYCPCCPVAHHVPVAL